MQSRGSVGEYTSIEAAIIIEVVKGVVKTETEGVKMGEAMGQGQGNRRKK